MLGIIKSNVSAVGFIRAIVIYNHRPENSWNLHVDREDALHPGYDENVWGGYRTEDESYSLIELEEYKDANDNH